MPNETEIAGGNWSTGGRGGVDKAFAEIGDGARGKAASRVRSVKACVSREERKKRGGVAMVNLLVWIVLVLLAVSTFGIIVILFVLGWIIRWLLSEYNVRKLQALGTTASAEQFPEISQALHDVCSQFGVKELPKVIVLNVSETNAFAVKFARKKVIVLLSQTLEGILNRPAELRFILAHELAHIILDHGARGMFEIYKPAAYKAARELTCDNCGCAAAGDVEGAKAALKRLGVGNELYGRLNDEFLQAEAKYIYSGFTGWLLKQYLTYPPLGKRVVNVAEFHAANC
jgi:Zn-dependent protease with chaperone function